MRDRNRIREPNLDPNGYTDVDFEDFKYLKYIPSENKAEWVKRQMENEVMLNSAIRAAEGPYGGLRTKWEWANGNHEEGVKNQRDYCKMLFEHKWDQLFKKEYDRKKFEERKYREFLIKLRRKYPSLKGYTHINEYNQFTIQAYLPDVIKFVGIKSLIEEGWFNGTRGYDIKGRLIKIFSFNNDSFLVELPHKKSRIRDKIKK